MTLVICTLGDEEACAWAWTADGMRGLKAGTSGKEGEGLPGAQPEADPRVWAGTSLCPRSPGK